ncbi:restriction endonuclease subunit S [Methanothrix sp.]|uniref:restriction endonuclease subunit S n=1 Tax=Methanothrix sp. TaxID=90426 RepID=UPI0032B01023
MLKIDTCSDQAIETQSSRNDVLIGSNSGGWSLVHFGDAVDFHKGLTYKSEDYCEKGKGIIFFNLRCVSKNGGFNSDGVKYYNGLTQNNDFIVPGDIVIANTDLTRDGDIIGCPVEIPEYYKDEAVCISMDLTKIVPNKKLDKKFCYYFLQLPYCRKFMRSHSSGSTVLHLNLNSVKKLLLPLPPLYEQRKIAAILSSVDAVIEQTDAIIAQTERMKTGLMQELFAKKFDIAKLGDCSFKPEYGYTTSAIFQPVGPKFIRITDLKDDGVDWASVPHCTCDEYVLKKYLLKPGDIIFARIGATTGKNYLIKENINCIFASYLIRIRCKDMLLPDFLYQFLKTSAYWNQINANKSGRLKEGINIPLLNGILIPLPSIQEQKKISLILSSIDERLDGEKKYRERLKKLKLGLMQDLLNGRVRVKVDGNV